MPQGSVLWATGRPVLWPASMEEIQVGVSMLNDDSARMKAPSRTRRAAGRRVRLQPPQLPLDPARQPFPAVSVSGRMALITGISRVSSTNRYRRFLQGHTPRSTLVQPLMLRLGPLGDCLRRKIACTGDIVVLFKGTTGLLWGYALSFAQENFGSLTGPLRDVTLSPIKTYMNSVRPVGGRLTAVVCPDGG